MGMGFFFQDPAKIHPADRKTIMEEFYRDVANPGTSWKLKDACAVKARLFVNALEPMSMTLIFDSCRKGRFANWALFALIAQHVVEHKMAPKFTQNECATVLISLGQLAKMHTEGILGDPESAIKQFLTNRERGAKNRDKTDHTPNIKLKRKKYRNAPITEQNLFPRAGTLVQMLCQTMYSNVMLHKSPVIPPRTVGELILGLGWLYRKEGGMFLGQSAKRVVRKMLEHCTESERILARCTTHDLCNMLHGCANLRYHNKKVFNKICGRLHGRLDKAWGTSDPGPGANETAKEGSESDDDFPEESSNKQLAQYKHWWDQKVEDSWEISDQDISNLTWACAKLGLYHTFVLRSLCPTIIDRLPEMRNKTLAITARSYGELFFENLAMCDAIAKEVVKPKRLPSIHEDHLADIIFGLAQMGLRDEPLYWEMTREITSRRTWNKYSERSLASLVSALGRMGYKEKRVIEGLGKEICSRGPGSHFTEEDYQNIVYGYEKLGYIGKTKESEAVVDEANEALQPDQMEGNSIKEDSVEKQTQP